MVVCVGYFVEGEVGGGLVGRGLRGVEMGEILLGRKRF